ncbi:MULTISPECIES: hypothetical protein [unclassified Clostridium]|uniref:hypothetical protein n=1 Tax=unclassified Clostridium TaxID=2614128 RepID=UPI0002980F98|nr:MULTISPECIES: hypothetical protein [unclassified Clostridium]EKQ56271.1 MAG: hypothetical protein A370_02027 [Clostridium sp. Maddingley MBC34-26]
MIDVSSVILDPSFAQTFTVYRISGDWVGARFVNNEPEVINMVGTISIANAKQIEFIPEGDRIGGEIAIHTTEPLYCSRNINDDSGDEESYIADELEWHGERYKVYQVNEYSDYGYYFAIGQRKKTD